jgi:hypothetical protein
LTEPKHSSVTQFIDGLVQSKRWKSTEEAAAARKIGNENTIMIIFIHTRTFSSFPREEKPSERRRERAQNVM